MRQTLRDYQEKADHGVTDLFAKGVKAVLLVIPTGGGKTSVAAHRITQVVQDQKRAHFWAHRKELIEQCSRRLDSQEVPHGIIKAGNRRVNNYPVQVASIQTLKNRVQPKEGTLFGYDYGADLIIIDEAHRAIASSYIETLKAFPDAKILGLTATPYRSDGSGLGDLFQEIVAVSSVQELTDRGYLVPARVFTTPLNPDWAKIKVKMGEFDQKVLEAVMNRADLVGDIYANWANLAADRKTVIFASSVSHSLAIQKVFESAGVKIAHLDGETPEDERDRILQALESGELQVVTNMGVLTEGWDSPSVSCCVLARPTKSRGLYKQMGGRALRTLPGEDGWPKERWDHRKKKDCLILDHGGNTLRHGLLSEGEDYSLDAEPQRKFPERLTTCFACKCIHNEKKCPACGFVNKKPAAESLTPEEAAYAQALDVVPADLEEVDIEALLKRRNAELDFIRKALQEQIHRGLRPGYMKKMFFEKFGRWPGGEVGIKAVWAKPFVPGNKPLGYRFEGVEYLDPSVRSVEW